MSSKVMVNTALCKGCALCVAACPKKLIELDKSKLNAKGYHAAICADEAACTACAICAILCPDSAITIAKEG